MTKFIIVRHCEAEQNRHMIFQGTLDGEVSSLGRRQLDCLSERMKDVHIDRIFSSPKKRAYATAEAINKYHNLPITVDERICEIDGGQWEGKCLADFEKLFPAELKLWNESPQDFVAPDGESMRSVYSRMSEFVCELSFRYPDETIAIASHGCAIKNLICWFKFGDLSKMVTMPWPANTAVYVAELDAEEKTLITENDISHLPDDIKTMSSQKWSKD